MSPKPDRRKLNLLPETALVEEEKELRGRFPSWLHRPLPQGPTSALLSSLFKTNHLHTVCEEAKCPNLPECWSRGTATFLALGKECTRSCGFCSIQFNKAPEAPKEDEPERIAASARALKLKHIVVTMVARDDLQDGGASHIKKIVLHLRQTLKEATVEVLTSDFSGDEASWKTVLEAEPHIFNYNLETVRRLTPKVRHKATYERTLDFLSYAKRNKGRGTLFIKSGLMVGLGETVEEVHAALSDLKEAGCDIVTLGQYLQSSCKKLTVKEFVHPLQFQEYEAWGKKIGLKYVYAGPFVRSSYNADQILERLCN